MKVKSQKELLSRNNMKLANSQLHENINKTYFNTGNQAFLTKIRKQLI